MVSKKIVFVFFVIEIILLFAYFSFTPTSSPINLPAFEATASFSDTALLAQRESYGLGYFVSEIGTQELEIKEAFRNLPFPPSDFFTRIEQLNRKYGEAINLEEAYFLQPEFLTNFKDHAFGYYENPNPTHTVLEGFGVLPFEQNISLSPGEQKQAVLFWHSAYGVPNFQGFKINGFYQGDKAPGLNISWTPEDVLLGPSYPFFHAAWNRKIVVTIKTLETAQPGNYTFAFDTASLDAKTISEWQPKYTPFVTPGAFGKLSLPRARLLITVQN